MCKEEMHVESTVKKGDVMIKSMTGFGRFEASDDCRKVAVEIKSVNHRYLDLNIKIPRRMTAFEAEIRNYVKQYIFRGKVDIYVSYEDYSDGQKALHYNSELAARYMDYFRQMEQEFGIENDVAVSRLSACPEVFQMESVAEDDDALLDLLRAALAQAVVAFNEAREKEGAALEADLRGKLSDMERYVTQIETRYPDVVNEYRTKLTDKVQELLADTQIEEARLASEVVIYADKICVDEETVRLRTHIQGMSDTLGQGDSIGRKLDFIAQEMNRESNTILSKSTDVEIADTAINLKTDVEKIREQVQNIE